ncbi:MAG: hypothetical protein ACFCVD_15890 [Nodosilinea sp.]
MTTPLPMPPLGQAIPYDQDYYGWITSMAQALRQGRLTELDNGVTDGHLSRNVPIFAGGSS